MEVVGVVFILLCVAILAFGLIEAALDGAGARRAKRALEGNEDYR